MESVRCTSRADLTLNGSFADLILLPGPGAMGLNSKDDLFVLTNPGQLHYYDNDSLSALTSQQNRTPSVCAQEFPVLIPMADPSLTVAKLIKLPSELNSSKVLAEVICFSAGTFCQTWQLICVFLLWFFNFLFHFILF